MFFLLVYYCYYTAAVLLDIAIAHFAVGIEDNGTVRIVDLVDSNDVDAVDIDNVVGIDV